MKLVCLSDTHNFVGGTHFDIPDGDVLIHAGDATSSGTPSELMAFFSWFGQQPHPYKLFVAGNHDEHLEADRMSAEMTAAGITYLQDGAITIDGVRFWGTPWIPVCGPWAFSLRTAEALWHRWPLIADETDVLITPTPPFKVLDADKDRNFGCKQLRRRLDELELTLHVFGHIHEGSGEQPGTHHSVNAAICDSEGEPSNPCRIFEIPPRDQRP